MNFAATNRMDARLEAAAKARAAMVDRFRARPGADDPAVRARQAERRAIVEAREQRAEERERARIAEDERLAALAAEERAAERARNAAEREAAAERVRLAQARQKQERDARYAARKANVRLKR